MTLNELRLEAITTRLDSWVRFGTPAPAEADVVALITEVRLMRRVHESDRRLLNTTREQLASVLGGYQEIADQLTAVEAQDAAERSQAWDDDTLDLGPAPELAAVADARATREHMRRWAAGDEHHRGER